ncbi:MAG: sulfatase/phosphatase domain-containing protein, partial [Verrucomicrobiota bacterium]
AHWDILATVAELAEGDAPEVHTGISFLPSLLGVGTQNVHPYLYWEFYEKGGKQAVRRGDWKAVRLDRHRSGSEAPWEIYHLKSDPGEAVNVAGKHPELQAVFQDIVAEASMPNEFFSWKE